MATGILIGISDCISSISTATPTLGDFIVTELGSNIITESGDFVSPEVCRSLKFDGVNEYINCTDNDAFSFGNNTSDFPFSMSAWVNIQEYDDPATFRIFSKLSTPGEREYLLYVYQSYVTFIMFANYSDFVYVYKRTTDSVSLNQWWNITATYDGRGGTSASSGQNIYINGQLAAANTGFNGTYTAMGNKFADLNIMASSVDGAFSEGSIASARMWNVELTPSEVLAYYNETNSATSVQTGSLVLDLDTNKSEFNGSGFDIIDPTGITSGYTAINMEQEDLIEDCPE